MIGWRTRLGVLVPSANIVMEPDMYRMAPQGVSVHFARVWITEDSPEELEGMIDYVPKCCEELSHGLMDVYGFGCTGGSLVGGPGYDRKIIKIMEEKTGKPATTTSTSVIGSFKELGITRVSVATPYEDWLNEKEKQFFEANGVEVLEIKGLGIRDPEGIASQVPGTIYRLAREVDRPEAQAIFISCTDFRAVEVLEVIERDIGKPAISSNQATLWSMLKLAGIKEPVRGFGSLLT
jgi:maleate isomerase